MQSMRHQDDFRRCDNSNYCSNPLVLGILGADRLSLYQYTECYTISNSTAPTLDNRATFYCPYIFHNPPIPSWITLIDTYTYMTSPGAQRFALAGGLGILAIADPPEPSKLWRGYSNYSGSIQHQLLNRCVKCCRSFNSWDPILLRPIEFCPACGGDGMRQ